MGREGNADRSTDKYSWKKAEWLLTSDEARSEVRGGKKGR